MIRITNGELRQAAGALSELARARLPVVGALRLRKLIRAVDARLEDVEAVRMDLLKRHAELDESGAITWSEDGRARLSDEAEQAFAREYEELMSQEAEFDRGIRPEDLGSIEVAPLTLLQLGSLLEDEGGAPDA